MDAHRAEIIGRSGEFFALFSRSGFCSRALLQDGKEAPLRIRPKFHAGEGRNGLSRFLNIGKLLENAAIRQQDPSRKEDFVRAVGRTLDEHGVLAEFLRRGGYHWFQIQVPVRNVHSQNAVWSEMAEIKFEGFERQEVNGNGVA